jgi:hypothetical protein
MPIRHNKGEIVVPAFLPSGTGRDLYLNPASEAQPPPTQGRGILGLHCFSTREKAKWGMHR